MNPFAFERPVLSPDLFAPAVVERDLDAILDAAVDKDSGDAIDSVLILGHVVQSAHIGPLAVYRRPGVSPWR